MKHGLGELSNLGAGTLKLLDVLMGFDRCWRVFHNNPDRIHRMVPVRHACDVELCLAVPRTASPGMSGSSDVVAFLESRETLGTVVPLVRQLPDRSSVTRCKQQEVVWGAANV